MAYTTINKGSDYFNTKLYTGNGATGQSITGVGFQPDWTWLKLRSTTGNNGLFDAVRGATKRLQSNQTNAEDTIASFASFDSDGFTLSEASQNNDGETFASWNWLAANGTSANTDGSISSTVSANTTAGFSIVSYAGNGTNPSTIGHGLGAKPDLMIVKSRDDAENWLVGSDKISGWNWSSDYLHLNASSAKMTDAGGTAFNTAPTSSVFSVGAYLNGSGEDYIAYMFTSIKGYSKIGTYTGNGNADGPFIYTGFKPAWLLIKRTSGAENWVLWDNKRDPFNNFYHVLLPNASSAEDTTNTGSGGRYIGDFLSNGFKPRNTHATSNASGSTYVYMAFAEHPFVSSTGTPVPAR